MPAIPVGDPQMTSVLVATLDGKNEGAQSPGVSSLDLSEADGDGDEGSSILAKSWQYMCPV